MISFRACPPLPPPNSPCFPPEFATDRYFCACNVYAYKSASPRGGQKPRRRHVRRARPRIRFFDVCITTRSGSLARTAPYRRKYRVCVASRRRGTLRCGGRQVFGKALRKYLPAKFDGGPLHKNASRHSAVGRSVVGRSFVRVSHFQILRNASATRKPDDVIDDAKSATQFQHAGLATAILTRLSSSTKTEIE